MSVRPLSTLERIAEIDKQLAAPLTGAPDDADRRAQLRAERDALAGHSSMNANRRTQVVAPSQPGPQNSHIIVARDTQRSSGDYVGNNRWVGWEGLTPSEKKERLKLIRTQRPDVVIDDYRH